MLTKLNQNIFRAYDIRGTYPNELNEKTIELIGKAYVSYLIRKQDQANPVIVVGKDNRIHGKALQKAFIKGTIQHGAHIKKVEDCTSPMLYHSICENNFNGGVNITASHNPSEYNGCKLQGKMSHSIAGEEIQNILQMILNEDFEDKKDGIVENIKIKEAYYKKISSIITLKSKLKIIIDAGNGIAGKYYPELFRKLGCEVIELYCDQDGRFPNHTPDPVEEENTKDLKNKVIEEKADIGISFDGDGDRCAIIDEKGIYHDANESMVILIRYVLEKNREKPIVYTVSNSLIIHDEIRKQRGKGIMVKVGHSHVEHAMDISGALFGGEQSGHFFLSENYYNYDDAAYVAAKLLEIFTKSEGTVSKHYEKIQKTISSPEYRIDCPDERKFQLIQEITQSLKEKFELNTLDGLKLELEDGSWMGMRASNTSPKISVIMETKSKYNYEKLMEIAEEVLNKHELSLKK